MSKPNARKPDSTDSQARPNAGDLDKLCKMVQEMNPSPETILAFLLQQGIIDKAGQLTDSYNIQALSSADDYLIRETAAEAEMYQARKKTPAQLSADQETDLIRKAGAEVTTTKAAAVAFLQAAGILDNKGKLAKQYQ